MTLSKTTEYALRILTFMAANTEDKYSSVYLHSKLKIPKKYLQRLLTDLSKNGLIKSIQGRKGGFVFAKPIDKIYISDIIDAVEGFSNKPSCFFGFKKCLMDNPCIMHDVWTESQEKLIKVFNSTSLKNMVNKK